MVSARKRIIMGLSAPPATMSQDWIEPVGRLPMPDVPWTGAEYQVKVNAPSLLPLHARNCGSNRQPEQHTSTTPSPATTITGARAPGQNYVGGGDPGGAGITGLERSGIRSDAFRNGRRRT
jgi:hypothetical protein